MLTSDRAIRRAACRCWSLKARVVTGRTLVVPRAVAESGGADTPHHTAVAAVAVTHSARRLDSNRIGTYGYPDIEGDVEDLELTVREFAFRRMPARIGARHQSVRAVTADTRRPA